MSTEIDKRIAREVMEWEWCDGVITDGVYKDAGWRRGGGLMDVGTPPLSTSMTAAWRVAERMQELGWCASIELDHPTENWCALFYKGEKPCAYIEADTTAMAICLAALEAVND